MIVTFLALLEVVKQGKVRIRQSQMYGDIWIYKAEGDH